MGVCLQEITFKLNICRFLGWSNKRPPHSPGDSRRWAGREWACIHKPLMISSHWARSNIFIQTTLTFLPKMTTCANMPYYPWLTFGQSLIEHFSFFYRFHIIPHPVGNRPSPVFPVKFCLILDTTAYNAKPVGHVWVNCGLGNFSCGGQLFHNIFPGAKLSEKLQSWHL